MSFLDALRKAFIYTGDQGSDVDTATIEKTKPTKPRLNIGNPIQRIKDVKEEAMSAIRENSTIGKSVVSNKSKKLIYSSLYTLVEADVQKGKPIEEARVVFKKFLEDKVTDEAMYSDEDILYVQSLCAHIRTLKNISADAGDIDELGAAIIQSPNFLNIIEVLDVFFGYKYMAYACERSYIVCGYTYQSRDNPVMKMIKSKAPTFNLDIDDSSYMLLNEVSSLVSNGDFIYEKEAYITKKVSPYLLTYLKNEKVPPAILAILIELFKYTSKSDPAVKTEPEQSPKVTIKTEPTPTKKEDVAPTVDSTPISQLKKESSFILKFGPLADYNNNKVTINELMEAKKDIEFMIFVEDLELDESETHIYNTIKLRLKTFIDDEFEDDI